MAKVEAKAEEQGDIPIACSLSEEQLAAQREGVGAAIRGGVQETRELPDGYEMRFPGTAEWTETLTGFIVGERDCCPFFTFELVFEANRGPIWFRLRGPEGVKQFLEEMTRES